MADPKESSKPGQSVVEWTAGVFKHEGPPRTAEELREDAEQAIAEEAIERSGT